MKFLIDTNIFIPIEIVSEADVEPNTPRVALLSKNIQEIGNHLYVHPAQKIDIDKDTNESRKRIRKYKFQTYPSLSTPPQVKKHLKEIIGAAEEGSNDWVDDSLIAAAYYNAVDFLVTEDKKLIKKAERLNLRDRVINLDEAHELIDSLFDKTPTPPPAVEQINAYDLNIHDPIFDGLKSEYPGFEDWLKKCMKEDRPTWIVMHENKSNYAAFCILKREDDNEVGLNGKTYKICTFKVLNRGIKLGELLLKTIFKYVCDNSAEFLYVEVYPKYEYLQELLEDFGFNDSNRNKYTGELRLVKSFKYRVEDKGKMSPVQFNKVYGPFCLKTEEVNCFLIPILPEYHRLLFPESEQQTSLFSGRHSFGNSIRKAYLCNSNSRLISIGDIILFYRSRDLQAITVIGIVEGTLVSQNPNEIARFVGKRTVYTFEEIQLMCKGKEVLSVLFRQVIVNKNHYPLKELIQNSILQGVPQSITKLDENIKPWIEQTLQR